MTAELEWEVLINHYGSGMTICIRNGDIYLLLRIPDYLFMNLRATAGEKGYICTKNNIIHVKNMMIMMMMMMMMMMIIMEKKMIM